MSHLEDRVSVTRVNPAGRALYIKHYEEGQHYLRGGQLEGSNTMQCMLHICYYGRESLPSLQTLLFVPASSFMPFWIQAELEAACLSASSACLVSKSGSTTISIILLCEGTC